MIGERREQDRTSDEYLDIVTIHRPMVLRVTMESGKFGIIVTTYLPYKAHDFVEFNKNNIVLCTTLGEEMKNHYLISEEYERLYAIPFDLESIRKSTEYIKKELEKSKKEEPFDLQELKAVLAKMMSTDDPKQPSNNVIEFLSNSKSSNTLN